MQTTAEAVQTGAGRRPAAPEIELASLGRRFGDLEVLAGVSLRAGRGEVLGVVGPSGCGKSTLLEIVCGLREPDRGSVAVEGAHDARGRLALCAFMPQRDLLLPWMNAIDNAALALRNRGMARGEARDRAAAAFERLGLGGFEDARPHELSGGMRQRVAFLRTLLAGKPVLLLDEPFASLDAITRAEMQEWLAGALAAESRTVVLVTHDVEEALYLSDRVVVMSSRPATVVTSLAAPDPRSLPRLTAVTAPGFTSARERALLALAEGRT